MCTILLKDGSVRYPVRAEGEDGKIIGDFMATALPGTTEWEAHRPSAITEEEWRRLQPR